MPTVIKVQRPIVTNSPHIPWMVYDQLRVRCCQINQEDIPGHVRRVMKDSYKEFFIGEWDTKTHLWTIGNHTHLRNW